MTKQQQIKSIRTRLRKLDSEIEDLEDTLDHIHVSVYKKLDRKKTEYENLEAKLYGLLDNVL